MIRVVAILETMWDWRQQTSGAGYAEAPRYFRISPENYSGKRLYKLVGPDAQLLVTNACRELVTGPEKHGKGDPVWLSENLQIMDGVAGVHPGGNFETDNRWHIDVLLVCGKVAQMTFAQCGYRPKTSRVLEIPHPAARMFWTMGKIAEISAKIQGSAR
jgi:hypothetical protein